MKLSRVLVGSAVAVSLVGAGLMSTPVSAQDNCVTIRGGDVSNVTSIDLNANAGTAISDSSAGSNNLATTSGGNAGVNVASAGNGGVATGSANGGAISLGDINSGGNVGNAISVGNTVCPGAVAPMEAAPEEVAAVEEVVALPATGVGAGEVGSLFAIIASAGAAAASLGLRRR
jgi:hypothetical protein